MRTPPSRKIDQLLAPVNQWLTRSHGFKRKGRFLLRSTGYYWHSIQFAASAFNSVGCPRFQGLYSIASDLELRVFRFAPGSKIGPEEMRIGKGGDLGWWEINESADITDLARQLITAITAKALPAFERFNSEADFVRQLGESSGDASHDKVNRLIFLLHSGDTQAVLGAANMELTREDYTADDVSFRYRLRKIVDYVENLRGVRR